ncbi:MAG: ATP-binding cassette domain-containing protein, partial [Clostridia bacterium]|nr:ATP-binding cassette domain-containing protein [Clostridia bacterium]
MNEILKCTGLSKRYANVQALNKVDLTVERGKIIGILGHNGAGKSTTIKCITGMHPYELGEIVIAGHDLKTDSINAKMSFGYVSDDHVLFERMT